MSDAIQDKIKEVLKDMGYGEAYDPQGDLEAFYKLQPRSGEKAKNKEVYVYDLTPEDDSDRVKLVPIFDVHVGSNTFDHKMFEAFVAYILNEPNTYTVLGGDLHESATRTSVGRAILEEEMHLKGQRRYLEEVLKPLAEKGKILVGIPGNHEERVAQFNGDCPMEELCHDLGVPYAGYQAYLRIKVGDQKYDTLVFHGTGGGRSKGAKANSAIRQNEVAWMDLYLSGHTHDKTYMEDGLYYINDDDELTVHKRVYVVCGSYLTYFNGYSEMKALPPSITGGVRIDLMRNRKGIHVHY